MRTEVDATPPLPGRKPDYVWVATRGKDCTFLPTQESSLTIGNLGAGNEVGIEKFNLPPAQNAGHYLGIQLDNTAKLVIKDNTGINNFRTSDSTPQRAHALSATKAFTKGAL